MIINYYLNIISLIYSVLNTAKFKNLKACRKNFIATAFGCFSCLKVRKNFLNFDRFTDRSEQYFRINFEQNLIFKSLTCK
jgi:hypothetical protein